MKYLLINRHAESPWSNFNVSDHDRELDSKGVSDASMMGKRLLNKEISFDLMLTSSAIRALTTCQLIASEISYPLYEICVKKDIYNSNIDSLKDIICKIDSSVNFLAMFGHNPVLHMLSEEFAEQKIDRFPTCSMAYFELKINSWKDLLQSEKKMLFFDYPENERYG